MSTGLPVVENELGMKRARRQRNTGTGGVDSSLRMPLARTSDAFRNSLFLVIVINISAIHMYMGPIRLIRPALILVGFAVLLALLHPPVAAWKNITMSYPSRLVIVFFALACGSALFGLSPVGSALFILNVYIKNLILFFVLVIAIRNVHDLAWLMWSFVVSVGVLVGLALTVLDLKTTIQGLARLEGGQGSFDANDIGMILVMAIPLALLFFYSGRWLTRMLCLGIIVGIAATIALTGSRGAMIGLAVVGIAILVVLRRISVARRAGILAAVVIALFFAAPDGYWKQMGTLFNLKEDYNFAVDYGRKGIAQRGVGYMLRYPLLGVGIANFGRAEGTLSPIARARRGEGLSVQWIAPHNTYVQVGAEMGVTALIIWLSLLFGGSVGLWRLRKRIPASWEHESAERKFLRDACLFLPISFIGFAVTSLFLSHAYTVIAYIVFAFFGGVHLLVHNELRKDLPPGTSGSRRKRRGEGSRAFRSVRAFAEASEPKPLSG